MCFFGFCGEPEKSAENPHCCQFFRAGTLAWVASLALIRHGVRPLLHINDEKTAHYVTNRVTLSGIAAWIGLLVVSAVILSMLIGSW
jgi:hypothetical protein